MSRSSLRFLVALLMVSCGMIFADEPALIDPETTIVTVDDVKLTAGLILVPVGGEFKEWWRGQGQDEETQKRVRAKIDEYTPFTINDEILRAMMDKMLHPSQFKSKRAHEIRSNIKKEQLIVSEQCRVQQKINDWEKQVPEAALYITEWLARRSQAHQMGMLETDIWLQDPAQAKLVRTYWKEHQGEYTVLKSARWQQATVSNETAEGFQRRLDLGANWGALIQKLSTDRYHLQGGAVESTFPHLLIPETVVKTLRKSKPDQRTKCIIGDETVFLLVESLEVVPGEFVEVVGDVKADLARLYYGGVAIALAEKRRAGCRIEWQCKLSN